jgi:hypothetical protein
MFTVRYNRDLVVNDSVFHTENYGHALLRYNDSGELISATNFGIPDVSRYVGDHSRAIINPNNGDVLLTGCYNGSIGFDETTQLHGASGCSNVYITLFNDTTLLHPWGDTNTNHDVNIAGIENKDISVYPNPASDKIMVKAGKNISDMVLYNVKGEAVLVKRGSSLNGQSVIEINGLNDGIYFLKIVTSDGTSTKKIIKK